MQSKREIQNHDLPWAEIDPLIDQVLAEDKGAGDITTDVLIPASARIEAEWVAKEPCRIAGLLVVDRIFRKIDPQIEICWRVHDSQVMDSGKFGLIQGPAKGILRGERVALNFLQRLCGIATLTAKFVDKVRKYGVQIYDTRKTTPGLRVLEKYAVRMGGGMNHRLRLDDMILVKDNHRAFLEESGVVDWRALVRKIRKDRPGIPIEIECASLEDLAPVVGSGTEIVLLDNLRPDEIRKAVQTWKGKVLFEASGGIDLENVEQYAQTGVDRISIGALTHSVRAIDLSLEVLKVG